MGDLAGLPAGAARWRGIRRQAGVDRLEQFQPANAPLDVAHQVLADLVGVLELRLGLRRIGLEVADLAAQVAWLGFRRACQRSASTLPSASEEAAKLMLQPSSSTRRGGHRPGLLRA